MGMIYLQAVCKKKGKGKKLGPAIAPTVSYACTD